MTTRTPRVVDLVGDAGREASRLAATEGATLQAAVDLGVLAALPYITANAGHAALTLFAESLAELGWLIPAEAAFDCAEDFRTKTLANLD